MRAAGKLALCLLCAALIVQTGAAAELQSRTAAAFEEYEQNARREFLARTHAAAELSACDGVRSARPARQDGIVEVPGGLVHNWRADGFARGLTLEQIIAASQDYTSYKTIYKEVTESTLLSADSDVYRVEMRIRSGARNVNATLLVTSTVRYLHPDRDTVITLAMADRIQEVRSAGLRGERVMPPGKDSGYLWRAATYTYFHRARDGVYMEMETLGLSRQFPALMGWIIEPIAKRLGQRSVEGSLQQFLTAVKRREHLAPVTALCGNSE